MTAYTKHTWQHAETIHTDDLNYMEDGIVGAYTEITALANLMEENNYINRTFTNPNIALDASGGTTPSVTISDLDTSSGSAIAVEVQNVGDSTSLSVHVYGKIGTLPYTTDPIKEVTISAATSSTLFFITPPQDLIKIIIDNDDAVNATTINVVTRVLGNIAFMIQEQYDTDLDGVVNEAELAQKASLLTDGGAGKSYANVAAEIDSDIATHTAIAAAHHTNANDPTSDQKAALAGVGGTPNASNKYVTNSDTRLSDARTPVAHTHVVSSITDIASNYEAIISSKGTAFNKNFGDAADTVCVGNDSRLTNTRTPTLHGDSHKTGGSDALKIDDLAAPDDNTDLNATNSAHGLCPKLVDDTTKFLRSDGTWHTPAGTGGVAVEFGTEAGTCCEGNDARLDPNLPRTPVAHANTHAYSGSDPIAIDNLAVPTDITRCNVSNAAHGLCPKLIDDTGKFLRSDGSWQIPPGILSFGTSAGTACEGNDARLSNARVPSVHASSHISGASDPIKLDDLAAPDDNTDLNASTTKHGLCPKGSGVSTQFLNGLGTWSTPTGVTPAAHATSHKTGGSDAVKLDELATPADNTNLNASTTYHGLCPKLPNDSTKYLSGVGTWVVPFTFGTTTGTVCQGDDARLSDSRNPTVHSTSHKTGGSDVIKIDELGTPTDNTNLNVTSSAHGLCPKLINDTSKYFRSDGTWQTLNTSSSNFIRWEEGTLSTSTTFMPYRVTSAKQVKTVKGYIVSPPTGASIFIDIRKNDTTLSTASIFNSDAAQAISTSITATNGLYQFDFSSALDAAMTSCVDGDILYVVITQVGSTLAGTGLYLEVGF